MLLCCKWSDMMTHKEKNLFATVCPYMSALAADVPEEILNSQVIQQ